VQRWEVESQLKLVSCAVVASHSRGVEQVDLSDHDSLSGIRINQTADDTKQGVHVFGVVDVGLLDRRKRDRIAEDVGRLDDAMKSIGSEPIHPSVEPESQHVVHGRHDVWIAPVQIGLLGQKRCR
jgi:hypothetical protein